MSAQALTKADKESSEAVKYFRKKLLGLTQAQFSKKLSVRLSTVGKWESCNPPPGVESLAMLGRFAFKHGYTGLGEDFGRLCVDQTAAILHKSTRIQHMGRYVLACFDASDEADVRAAIRFLHSSADRLEEFAEEKFAKKGKN